MPGSGSHIASKPSVHKPHPPRVPDHQLPFMKHAGDLHMGAKEDQVSRTMPPKADDDEPKQG